MRAVPAGDAAPEPPLREVPRRGFVLLGVNVDDDSAKAAEVATKLGVTFPVLLDTEKSVSKLYDVEHDAVDHARSIATAGPLRPSRLQAGYENDYEKQIRELLK